jgi:hypothetical protein
MPHNPSTTITFDVAQGGRIQLLVYNLLGQQVATLVNEPKEPGRYTVKFGGGSLASGVYLYRLSTEAGFSSVRKMIIMK